MAKRRRDKSSLSGPQLLAHLVQQAVDVAKKAKKHHQNLKGDNFYATKLVELRIDATNVFSDLSAGSVGDATALAEFIEIVFSPSTDTKRRLEASREITFGLQTMWAKSGQPTGPGNTELFPQSILTSCNRNYLVSIGRQMNGCFGAGWLDAAAVMMRRLLEVAIIEAFEANTISHKIKMADGNYFQLSELIKAALAETTWNLTRNSKTYLPQLRDVGHMSAHGRYFHARLEDIQKIALPCRVVIEEFLHHAKIL